MIGRTLEQYRIESTLGEGGMGVVYKAHDSRLNRWVAIKVLLSAFVADPTSKRRFVQEAKAASALNHPGIVTIHDIRSDAGTDYIVMEYIEGRTLEKLIPVKGMPIGEALRYAVQIADALAQAHAAGILHRDLKPSNVMVTPEGRVKILDFGVAKLLEQAESGPGATTVTASLTGEHGVVGTAAYMSPEQAEGRTLDARSDIFSFGVVLYEMVTGRRPFTGDSRLALLTQVLSHDPTPPHQIVASIPTELEATILRGLRKDPSRRFQTMADLKVAIEDLEEASRVSRAGRRSPTYMSSRLRWALAAFLTVGLVAAYIAWRNRSPAEPVGASRATALTTLPGQELYPSLSPDGNYVAFTWTGPKQDNTDIYVQQIGVGAPLPLTSDVSSDYNPVWSPDGRWIAFLRGRPATPLARSDRELRLIPPLGGPERKLTDVSVQEMTVNPVYLGWCPDSSCVIVTDSSGEGQPDALSVVSLETGEKRRLTNPQPPVLADTDPVLSPNGESLLFLRRTTWASGELHVLPVRKDMTAAGEVKHIAVLDLKPDNATWLPNSEEIVLSTSALAGGANLWRLPVSGSGRAARLPFVGEDGVMPSVSRSEPGRPSRLVYVRSFTDENIWRIDVAALGGSTSVP
ncbi:MAG: serine/threonine-protein kinase, partial [Acidobacteria bacterium]